MNDLNFKATALKHRPQSFSDLIGQEHVSTTISNAIKNNRIAHAYLFSGPRGVGKTSAARILAKSLNCERGTSSTPCGNCSNCIEITSSTSLDVNEIDGASNRGVDQIRELRESVRFSPAKSKYKIYIIDEVHMLTNEAFNALLKTLEEPPAYVIFIFATTEPAKVKITIRSRCQHYRFKRINTKNIQTHLNRICKYENINASEEALFLISKASDGSMRDSQSLLDQVISYAGGNFNENHVKEIIGLIDTELYFDFLTFLLEKDTGTLLKKLHEMDDEGIDFSIFISGLAEILRNLILIIEGSDAVTLEMVQEDYSTLKSFYDPTSIDGYSFNDIIILLDIIIDLSKELNTSLNPKRTFELYIFRLLNFRNMISPQEILKRIETLQQAIQTGDFSPQVPQTQPNKPIKKEKNKLSIEITNPEEKIKKKQNITPEHNHNTTKENPAKSVIQDTEPKQNNPINIPAEKPKQQAKPTGNINPGQLFEELIQHEKTSKSLADIILTEASRVDIENNTFIIYFHPKNSFHKNQIEEMYKEKILSFLSKRTGMNIKLECRFEQTNTKQNFRINENPSIKSNEDKTQKQNQIAENVKKLFKGEIIN